MTFLIITYVLAITTIVVFWVNGITNMKNKYPDYKGEDFLNEDQ